LNIYYGQEADKWMRHNPGRPLTHYQVCNIFGVAYHRAASLETAANGFRNAGIWPVDHDVFKDCDFAPSDVTYVEQTPANTSVNVTAMAAVGVEDILVNNDVHLLPLDLPGQYAGTPVALASTSVTLLQAASHSFADGLEFTNATDSTVAVEYVNMAAVAASDTVDEAISIPTFETAHLELSEMRENTDISLLEENSGGIVELTGTKHNNQLASCLANTVDGLQSSGQSKSIQKWIPVTEISPLPRRSSAPKKRRGNTMEATILTGSPYKTIVEERLKVKQAKQTKRDGKKKLRFDSTAGSGITKTRVACNMKPKRRFRKSKSCETEASTAQLPCIENNATYHCLVCGEAYEEAWIQCKKCKLWAHEACAELSHSKYYCDNCNVMKHSKSRKLKK
jgi:hypothetical protein